MLANFDSITSVHRDSGHHVLPDTSGDFSKLLEVLTSEKVFDEVPNRSHDTFKHCSADPYMFARNNTEKLFKWLQLRKDHTVIEQQLMYPKQSQ